MRFSTKIGLVVRDDLAAWKRLNVTAFLSGGIAGAIGETVGLPYRDGSGVDYLPMLRQPVLVFTADAGALNRAHGRALGRGLRVGVYTEELFGTDNDADNRAAVAAVPTEKLALVGIAVYGPRADVDKALKGLTLHP
ncbi:hypothetical protein Athai_11760 [Actinocatenispora thailandica]|uniref:DUF2000 domain-containing protein n=1 Tax=Actinocatenispora thailandica TaxID=227318 RepID=A0A7R7DL83_9ACTN|nr:DUF2000 domain-containing protein [Actinocatenispora thailandica]BCJ33673.1 hypothetical protein Athai_11760 [Actinocatenispora thailandica]